MRPLLLATVLVALASGAAAAAAEPLAILSARPAILSGRETLTLTGSAPTDRAGEPVTIEARFCGSSAFRYLTVTPTFEGGGWTARAWAHSNATLRAVWRGRTSNEVSVLVRPHLTLGVIGSGLFRVEVTMAGNLRGKELHFQRHDRRSARWVTLRKLRLAGESHESLRVRSTLPKGSLLRLHLPLQHARPCYLAGYSNLMRT